MGCNGFHMSREFPERYDEYELLNVPQVLEDQWRREQFFEYYVDVVDRRAKNLSIVHSSMAELLDGMDIGELETMLEATRRVVDAQLPAEDRLVVAGAINGRTDYNDRMGLIYRSIDAGRRQIAADFAALAFVLTIFTDADAQAIDAARALREAEPLSEVENFPKDILELLEYGPTSEQLRESYEKARSHCVEICRELGLPISKSS
jgi:hypothetical protein